LKFAGVLSLFGALAACGGGGSASNSPPPPPPPPLATHVLGGTVNGLDNGGRIVLANGADLTSASLNGPFTFPGLVEDGHGYSVKVSTQPHGQACSVTNGDSSSMRADFTAVAVTCVSICKTTLNGILHTSTTYDTQGSPYCISSSLQIPTGVTATFAAGTSVAGLDGSSIVVQGGLTVDGTSTARVSLNNVVITPAGLQAAPDVIDIHFANISEGSLYAPANDAAYSTLNLTDSAVSDMKDLVRIWYPVGTNVIARNVFRNSGGIFYGADYNDATISIANNYFADWTTGYALANGASYNGIAFTQGNTFATTSTVAVMLYPGPDFTSAAIDASNNYWGTTDPSVIQQMIFDINDDIRSAGTVTYTPFLTAPAPSTPTPAS
jgi:hypothetical protein